MLTTGRRDQVAVTVEVTAGTPVAAAAGDIVRSLSNSANRLYQGIENLVSQERTNSLSIEELIQDAAAPGEFDLTVYLKGSGTAGTPVADGYRNLLKGHYGRETVSGGVSVTYARLRIDTDTRLTYTLLKKFGDGMVIMASGCLLNVMRTAIRKRGNESILQAQFTGPFMKRYWGGKTVTVAGSDTTHVNLATGTAKRFSVGMYITVGALTPNPVAITAIDYATDILTVGTLSGSAGVGVAVSGWFPTAAADAAKKISGWRGVGTLAGTTFPHREIDWVCDNKINVLDDIRDGTAYPSQFIEGEDFREITARVNHYFDSSDVGGMHGWYDADTQQKRALIVPVGNVAGSIYTWNAPLAMLTNIPTEDTSGKVTMERMYRMMASSTHDDEDSLILT